MLKLLAQFRLSLDAATNNTAQGAGHTHSQYPPELLLLVRMRLELTALHLHAPFEDVQIFAGIEGAEQARGAYPVVLDWARTEVARKAICHAGQVLRFAVAGGGTGRGLLQGVAAVVMYQASLVLWVYALLVHGRKGKGKGHNAVGLGSEAVWLDGVDEFALQRFTHFGVGMPCIRGAAAEGGVSLGDPEAVLGAIIGILNDSFEGLPRPHLVERLLHLMEALQRSSGGVMEFHGQLERQ